MAIVTVSTSNTFNEWRVVTNQLVTEVNKTESGTAVLVANTITANTITANSDVTVSGNTSITGTLGVTGNVTLAGELRGPATFTIDPAAVGDNTGTVVIKGNLQVDGSTTTINSTTLTIDDKNIVVASGAADNAAADGAGLVVDGSNASITYLSTGDKFNVNKALELNSTLSVAGNTNFDTGTLFIDTANDRVGIGTTSPSVRLHVELQGSSEIDVARFQSSNGADIQFLDIGSDPTNNQVTFDVTGSSSGNYLFRSGGTDRAIFTSAGRFGFNTTNTDNGTINVLSSGTANAYSLYVGNVDGTYNPYIRLYHDADGIKLIQSSTYGGSASHLQFEIGGVHSLSLKPGETIFNEGGADQDFRVESDTNTHAFFVDAGTSRVGIGVTAPAASLNVSGNQINFGTNPYIALSSVYNTTPAYLQLNTTTGQLEIYNNGTGTNGFITFTTGAGAERVRITHDGKVGIGKTNPTQILDVNGTVAIGTTAGAGFINLGTSSGVSQYQYINFGGNTAGDDAWQIGRSPADGVSSNAFYIYDLKNSATRVALANTGFLGIGTTSPAARLNVVDSGTANTSITDVVRVFYSATNTPTVGYGAGIAFQTAHSSIPGSPQTRVVIAGVAESVTSSSEKTALVVTTPASAGSGSQTERFRITSDGRVGIGVTAPSQLLHIKSGGGSAAYVQIEAPSYDTLTLGVDSAVARIESTSTTPIAFRINGAEKMRITNGSGVGIGTTSPSYALHVVGDIYHTGNRVDPNGFKTKNFEVGGRGDTITRCEIAQITRDINDWGYAYFEVIVRHKYYANGGYSRYQISYGYSSAGVISCLDAEGSSPVRVYLGSEVTVSGDIRYRPVYVDLPSYYIVDVQFTYASGMTEIAAGTTFSNYNQIKFPITYSDGSGSGNFNYYTTRHIFGGGMAIGTESPTGFGTGNNKLVLAGSSGATYVDSAGTTLTIDGNGTNTPITFYARYSNNFKIQSDSFITFGTGSSPAERVRITSTGSVGIGTTNPQYTLDVSGNARIGTGFVQGGLTYTQQASNTYSRNQGLIWVKLCTLTSPISCRIKYYAGTGNSEERGEIAFQGTYVQSYAKLKLSRQTYNGHVARVVATCSTGGAPYEIWAEVDTGTGSVFASGILFAYQVLEADNTVSLDNTTGTPSNIVATVSTGATQTANFTDAWTHGALFLGGNVGIGTTAPNYKLTIRGGSGTGFQMENSDDDSRGFRISITGAGTRGVALNTTSSLYPLTFGIDSVEKMRLSTSGRLGIGTTAPNSILHVSMSIDNGPGTATRIDTGFGAGRVVLHNQDAVGTGNKMGLVFAHAGDPGVAAVIASYKESGTWRTGFQFYTNAQTGGDVDGITERMRITADGDVGIGTTAPSTRLHVRASGAQGLLMAPDTGDTNNSARLFLSNSGGTWTIMNNSGNLSFRSGATVGSDSGTQRAYLDTSGNLVIGGVLTENSSIALKENVNPITNALDYISQLVGVTYDRKDGSAKNRAGLIKEEVEKVLPNVVNDNGIQYTNIIAYLVESIKDLKKEIEDLKKGN